MLKKMIFVTCVATACLLVGVTVTSTMQREKLAAASYTKVDANDVECISFYGEDDRYMVLCTKSEMRIYDFAERSMPVFIADSANVRSLTISDDGKFAYGIVDSERIMRWDLKVPAQKPEQIWLSQQDDWQLYEVALSPTQEELLIHTEVGWKVHTVQGGIIEVPVLVQNAREACWCQPGIVAISTQDEVIICDISGKTENKVYKTDVMTEQISYGNGSLGVMDFEGNVSCLFMDDKNSLFAKVFIGSFNDATRTIQTDKKGHVYIGCAYRLMLVNFGSVTNLENPHSWVEQISPNGKRYVCYCRDHDADRNFYSVYSVRY